MIKVRKGQAPPPISRQEFGERFRSAYFDPAFRAGQGALGRLEAIAWDGNHQSRKVDRFVGYYEPYATSHEALDRDQAVQDEVRNVAQALVEAVGELRAGRLSAPGADLAAPRPK